MPAGSLCHKKNDTIQNVVTILCFFLLLFLLPFLGGGWVVGIFVVWEFGGFFCLFFFVRSFVCLFFVFLSVFEIYLRYFTMMS